jgi:hypothetical protein
MSIITTATITIITAMHMITTIRIDDHRRHDRKSAVGMPCGR